MSPGRGIGAALTGALLLAIAALPAAAQRTEGRDPPRVLVTAWSGFSLREGQASFRFADDLVAFGGRVSLNRGTAARPWVQVDHFTRPDLNCQEGLACNESGTVIRAGVTLPLSEDDTRRGVHPRLAAGIGWGRSEERGLAYLLGFGAAWAIHPRFAPVFEARWERVPGLRSVGVLGLGLRLGLL